MAGLMVVIDDRLQDLTEADVRKMLVKRALEVARNPKMRWYLSAISRALQSVTNSVYEGRQRALRANDYIPHPFPEAVALKDELINLMSIYCMKQETMTRSEWDEGWETVVVPQINALAPS